MEFLTARDGVWQYQRRVPKDVRSLLGDRWRQSLKTQDKRVALVAARDLAATHDAQIAHARARLARSPAENALTELDETRKAIETQREALADRKRWRAVVLEPDPRLSENPESLEERISAVIDGQHRRLDVLGEAALGKANAIIAREAKKALPAAPQQIRDRVAEEGGVDALIKAARTAAIESFSASTAASMLAPDPDEAERPEQASERADEAAVLASRKERADTRRIEKESLLAELVPDGLPGDSRVTRKGALTIHGLYQRWCREAGIQPERQRKVAVYVRRFRDLFGNILAARVSKGQVREFAAVLAETPDITHLPVRDRKKDLRALVEIGRARPAVPRLSHGTINRHLEALAAIFAWAESEEILGLNPAHRIKAPKFAGVGKDIRPFKPAEIGDLLKCIDEYWGGSERVDRDRWWIVYTAAWSGMRLAEICQLRKSDVRQERGVWLFDINREDGKTVKNDASVRKIPIHPHLVDLGLIEHVNSSPNERAFPSLPKDRPGSHGHAISKSFGLLKKSKLKWSDPRLNFHSLRHSFEDAGKEAGVPKDVREALLGHAAGTYGEGFSLTLLAHQIARIDPLDMIRSKTSVADQAA